MPKETIDAINWSLGKTFEEHGVTFLVTENTPSLLVRYVREYFNTNNIEYSTFSYEDLKPYFN